MEENEQHIDTASVCQCCLNLLGWLFTRGYLNVNLDIDSVPLSSNHSKSTHQQQILLTTHFHRKVHI